MALEQAPVTGLLLAISALSTTFSPRHYTLLQRPVTQPTWRMTIKRLPLGSIPFGSLGVSLTDVLCGFFLLFQMRILERRWGSASYLSFVLTAAFAGSVVLNMCITESTPPLSLEQLRILSSGGALIPLVALAARHFGEVPVLHHWHVPFTSVVLTERVFIILPLIRLVFFPDTEIRARTHKHQAVHVDIGVWSRVLFSLLGIFLGIASARTPLLTRWLSFFSRRFCRPFLNFLRPVLSALFGPKNVADLGIPRAQPEQQARHFAPSGGRYTVDNLSGSREFGSATSFEEASPTGAVLRRRRNQINQYDASGTHSDADSGGVNDERIARLLELGLGADVDEIRAALAAANGHIDTAVEILVNRG